MLRELLAADIQRIEGIRAVGAVFQQILFGFRLLLHRVVLVESVAITKIFFCCKSATSAILVDYQ